MRQSRRRIGHVMAFVADDGVREARTLTPSPLAIPCRSTRRGQILEETEVRLSDRLELGDQTRQGVLIELGGLDVRVFVETG